MIELSDDEFRRLARETAESLRGADRRLFMARTVRALGQGGQRRAEIELAYVRKHSLRRDLRILLRTASAVFDPGIDPLPNQQP